MSEALTVVKVGGSLFDLPGLGARLESWLRAPDRPNVILTAGGGAAADVIRAMDRTHGLGEAKSHWLALRSLSLTAHLLAALGPASFRVIDFSWPPLGRPRGVDVLFPVLDLYTFACADARRPGCLPYCWDVTSDSLAARVAEVMGAHELILLKSVTIPPDMDWAEASRRGFVDGYFPTMIARGVRARAVNLREWRP